MVDGYILLIAAMITFSICFDPSRSANAEAIMTQYQREHIQQLKQQNQKLDKIARVLEKLERK